MILRVLILFLCMFISASAFATVDFSSEVVAKIGTQVVTSRKIQAESIMETFWKNASQSYKPLQMRTDRFSALLDHFLTERIVYLESKSFSVAQLDKKEINLTRDLILKRIKKNKLAFLDWKTLGLGESEIDDLVRQKIAAQKFMEFKQSSSLVPVTDAEALNYYHNNKKDYSGKSYSNIKEEIKKKIAKEQADQRLADWYDILRKKYDVMKIISVSN